LARAGIESDGPSAAAAVSVDDLFADLDMSSVDLQPPPFAEGKEDARPSNGEAEVEYGIPSPVSDAGSTTTGSGIIDVRPGPRLVVEALESDDGWTADVEPAPPADDRDSRPVRPTSRDPG